VYVGCRVTKYPPVSVIICALNEEQNLPHVLCRIPGWVDEVILVDGHSKDATITVAQKVLPDIRILIQPGKGKGDALTFGVNGAKYDLIVCLDADGDSPPEDIPKFVTPLLNGCDIAKGSRLASGRPRRMSRFNWVGNKVLAFTTNILYGTRFTDVCSGYYAFKKDRFLSLDLTQHTNEKGCSLEQQMIARSLRFGIKTQEVPYHSPGRISGKSVISGHLRATYQGFIDLFVLVRERFHAG
jgi:glycosyltransferase involved in cell wall biosynthesis